MQNITPKEIIDYVTDMSAQLAELCRADFPLVARVLDLVRSIARFR